MSHSVIKTQRLIIRPFTMDDLASIHPILGQAFNDQITLQERRSWLEWSILNQEWFNRMHQPPYGDRAIVYQDNQQLVGSIGFVPLLDAFDQIPALRATQKTSKLNTPELGLFWVISAEFQRLGYATEAAYAMIEHAFHSLRVKRILAVTEYTNAASQGVMRKLGMKLTRNPLDEPAWLQVVGVLDNPGEPA